MVSCPTANVLQKLPHLVVCIETFSSDSKLFIECDKVVHNVVTVCLLGVGC